MSNISVVHADSGLIRAEVARSERISPHVVRLTLRGDDLRRFRYLGYDQWVRLALPVGEGTRFDRLSNRFDLPGYLRYLTLPRGSRPVIRNYTIRAHRADPAEVDIDFVVHGDQGVAGPWAAADPVGEPVAMIDQGCGWQPVTAEWLFLASDESGMPAVASILRDLPREARGLALIELFDDADRQPTGAPDGMDVRWLTRSPADPPSSVLLEELAGLDLPDGDPYAFAVGESKLATGVRRQLIQRGVPKQQVTFSGYWKRRP